MPTALTMSMVKVIGRTTASASEKVSPGIEPNTSPMNEPTAIASRT
jgi:hypothetical protein